MDQRIRWSRGFARRKRPEPWQADQRREPQSLPQGCFMAVCLRVTTRTSQHHELERQPDAQSECLPSATFLGLFNN